MKYLALAALAFAVAPASAQVVYSNDFDTENGGVTALNYNGFSGLTVNDGSVDLIHTGDGFNIACNGAGGGCVDLDGSTGNAGVVVTSGTYSFAAGDLVTLSFALSGNQRGGSPDDIDVSFLFGGPTSGTSGFSSSVDTGGMPVPLGPFVNQNSIVLSGGGFPSDYPFDSVSFFFRASTAGTAAFSFADLGNDNIGLILDDVSLSIAAVPEPATWAMLIGGIGAVGGSMRTRRKAALATA